MTDGIFCLLCKEMIIIINLTVLSHTPMWIDLRVYLERPGPRHSLIYSLCEQVSGSNGMAAGVSAGGGDVGVAVEAVTAEGEVA